MKNGYFIKGISKSNVTFPEIAIKNIKKRNVSYKTLELFEKSYLEPSAIKIKRLLKMVIDVIDKNFIIKTN